MDSRLLEYYDRELGYLRDMGGEFARQYPGVADRLRIDESEIRDPYVSHLIQAFAFLSARLTMRFDDEFPTLWQTLLEAIYPSALAPLPWTAIMEMKPEAGAVEKAFRLPRGRQLRTSSIEGRSECIFTTSHDVVLRPIRITDVRYIGRDAHTLGADIPPESKAAMVIRIEADSASIGDLDIDYLRFFIAGGDETAARLHRQLMADALSPVVRRASQKQTDKAGRRLPPESIRPVGFEPHHALLPVDRRAFDGHRLLNEYFMLPQRHYFFDVGVDPVDRADASPRERERLDRLDASVRGSFEGIDASAAEIVIPFRRREESLETRMDRQRLRLHVTPIVNLFEKHTNRVDLSKRVHEHLISVDRMYATDFEIHTVLDVAGIGGGEEIRTRYRPFFSRRDFDRTYDRDSFFSIRRAPRLASRKSRKAAQTFDYQACDAFISIVDRDHAPYDTDVKQLDIRALCTNAHLAAEIASRPDAVRFRLSEHAPVDEITRLDACRRPRPSRVEREAAWRFISRLRLNYLSLSDDVEGAETLRSTLRLFADPDNEDHARQIDGVLGITSAPIVRPVTEAGRLAWVRGVGVRLRLDEDAFRGTGSFALGAVLDRFFAQYASINSLTETTLCTKQDHEIKTWPARTGRRWTL